MGLVDYESLKKSICRVRLLESILETVYGLSVNILL